MTTTTGAVVVGAVVVGTVVVGEVVVVGAVVVGTVVVVGMVVVGSTVTGIKLGTIGEAVRTDGAWDGTLEGAALDGSLVGPATVVGASDRGCRTGENVNGRKVIWVGAMEGALGVGLLVVFLVVGACFIRMAFPLPCPCCCCLMDLLLLWLRLGVIHMAMIIMAMFWFIMIILILIGFMLLLILFIILWLLFVPWPFVSMVPNSKTVLNLDRGFWFLAVRRGNELEPPRGCC